MELTSNASIKPIYVLIVVLFAVLIQISITFVELRKSKNKAIRQIIFDTQDTKYIIKKRKIVIGFIFIILSIVIYFINNKYDFIMGLLPVVLIVIGFVMVIPLMIKIVSKILSFLLKNRKTSFLASKNVAANKIAVSSTTLLFIIIAMTTMFYNIAQTTSNTYDGFDRVTHYTIRISNLSGEEENYKYLDDVDGVEEKAFYYINMGYFEINDEEKIFAFFGYDSQDDTIFRLYDGIKFKKEEANDLKDDEILLDEAFCIKNGYKLGDKIKINGEQYFDEDYYFTIKGYIDSTDTTSIRSVGMISKNEYNKLFKNNYKTILIRASLSDDVMKEKLKNEIKENHVTIQSYQEWIGSDKESTQQIMNIVYVVLFLGIALAMVGLINNGLVAFMQRKKGFAVLNSTCMTKIQLYKMVLEENIISFIISAISGISLSIILKVYMQKTINGMSMFVNMVFETKGVIVLLIIILLLTILQTIVPIVKMRKMDLVKEIKYE